LQEPTAVRLIQVLGVRCPNCEKLEQNAQTAVSELGIEATVERVSDITQIVAIGALMTPALAIDGQVRLVGKAASVEHIKRLLV
jgi:small redox-active disulfide protein 2